MEREQVRKLSSWFDEYVSGFYGEDDFVDANIYLKEKHSGRVCEEMRYLAEALGLAENQRRIAEVTALLHDIGRFEQFRQYRTYNDPRSINHCLLGLEILEQTGVLMDVAEQERRLIETAIRHHGDLELPGELKDEVLLFCRLIRDADKLDIFHVVIDNYQRYHNDPARYPLEIEFPVDGGYSRSVAQKIINGEHVDYHNLRTFDDMKLLQLGWVHDINFVATLKRVKRRGYLEKLLEFLPKDKEIAKVSSSIFTYMDKRFTEG